MNLDKLPPAIYVPLRGGNDYPAGLSMRFGSLQALTEQNACKTLIAAQQPGSQLDFDLTLNLEPLNPEPILHMPFQ